MSTTEISPDPPEASPSAPASSGFRGTLERYKPHASKRTQLLLAQMMWTWAGTMLFILGLRWIHHRYGDWGYLFAAPFLLLGLTKAKLVLYKVADKTVTRIDSRDPDGCAGGFFSWRSWGLILGMMALGQILRLSGVPRADLGFLYVAVGSALLLASVTLWRTWWVCRNEESLACR